MSESGSSASQNGTVGDPSQPWNKTPGGVSEFINYVSDWNANTNQTTIIKRKVPNVYDAI